VRVRDKVRIGVRVGISGVPVVLGLPVINYESCYFVY